MIVPLIWLTLCVAAKLHRVIMNALPEQLVDHKNGNGLNNQVWNLRVTTRAGNARGFNGLRTNNSSGYRGVDWNKALQKFRARLGHNNMLLELGYFSDAKEAARARDAKARELGWPEEGMNFPLDFSQEQSIVCVAGA